ncbi:hypothetical protein B0T14DRAFT_519787 [Immersiella caudata]|uniref:Uncharacterized protein n=1 Tax=Immersiella caudata TaxID=314043 RepID=A0AA39WQK8_9PEZI|nr:hypothetical protein B0T14DRAFT_519787 [Immersiella caudata]
MSFDSRQDTQLEERGRWAPPSPRTDSGRPVPKTQPGRIGYSDYSVRTIAAAQQAMKSADTWFEFSLENDYNGEAKRELGDYILRLEAFEAAKKLNERDRHDLESLRAIPQMNHLPTPKTRRDSHTGRKAKGPGKTTSPHREYSPTRNRRKCFMQTSLRYTLGHALSESLVELFNGGRSGRRSPSPPGHRQSQASSQPSAGQRMTYSESMGRPRRGHR